MTKAQKKIPLQLFNECREKFREITFRPDFLNTLRAGHRDPEFTIWGGVVTLRPCHMNGDLVDEFASRDLLYLDVQKAGVPLTIQFDPKDKRSVHDQFVASAMVTIAKYLRGKKFFLDPSRPLTHADFADTYHGNKTGTDIHLNFSYDGPRLRGLSLEGMRGTWLSFIPSSSAERKKILKVCEGFAEAYRMHLRQAEQNFV